MILLVIFGAIIVSMCLAMIVQPLGFAEVIRSVANKAWFFPTAFFSRLLFGVLFLVYASSNDHETLMTILGTILIAAAFFILLMGRKRVQGLAVNAANTLGKHFRWLGLAALPCGLILIKLGIY